MPRVYKKKQKEVKKPIEEPTAKPEEKPEKKTIAELVEPNTDNVIFTFSAEKNGYYWVELATKVANQKKLELRFK